MHVLAFSCCLYHHCTMSTNEKGDCLLAMFCCCKLICHLGVSSSKSHQKWAKKSIVLHLYSSYYLLSFWNTNGKPADITKNIARRQSSVSSLRQQQFEHTQYKYSFWIKSWEILFIIITDPDKNLLQGMRFLFYIWRKGWVPNTSTQLLFNSRPFLYYSMHFKLLDNTCTF